MTATRTSRAGISLMEVLISIGILAVGLTSVLSFIPAGRSMATNSFVIDQSAIVAANALADLVTQGYLRVESLSSVTSPVIIDPTGASPWPGLTSVVLHQNGVFAVASAPAGRTGPASSYLVRSRDDVSFNVPDDDALDVTNRFNDPGVRAYKGNFSWAALLTKAAGGAFAAGDEATLTIVVFHNRDANQPPPSLGPYDPNSGQVVGLPSPLIEDRKNSDLIRANGVCLVVGLQPVGSPPQIRRISFAAVSDGDTSAFIDFEPPIAVDPPPYLPPYPDLYLLPDAVAVIQKTITLESSSPYQE